jgi:tetratricopeptide (TPR) repeat protein
MKRCCDQPVGELIALYEMDALDDDQQVVFMDHLIECEYCYDQVYSLEPVMAVFRDHRAAARLAGMTQPMAAPPQVLLVATPKRFWNWQALAVAFSVLLIIGVGWFYLSFRSHTPEAVKTARNGEPSLTRTAEELGRNLEIPKPLFTAPQERIILRNPTAKTFIEAMAAYDRDDFASAIQQLQPLSELEADNAAEVKFYLGVSLLMVGRSQEAVASLKQAVELSAGSQLESRRFYLSLALLKSDQPDLALAELNAVITMAGEHRAEAERLRQRVSEINK